MGLFTSIFGSSGSDKSDRLRQQALDAFNSIKTPELAQLQVTLDKYVQAGEITPEQAEATLLKSNAFNSIKTDPAATGAQKMALQQLQDISTQGGLTAIDKAQLQDITRQQNQEAQSRNKAIDISAQERGVGGSGLALAQQMESEQNAADRASAAGTNVAANAQARALQAIRDQGQLGGQMQAQDYAEQANKSQAQNAIDQFNAQTQTGMNLYNVGTANQAQAANLANKQAIMNANTGTANQNKIYNAQQYQTQFGDEMQKASGKAGVLNNWASSAQDTANKEAGADAGIASGLINTAATVLGTVYGGPAGGMAANAVTKDIGSGRTTNTDYKRNPDGSYNFAEGGKVCPMCKGGCVHKAEGGEIVENDVVEIPKKEFITEHERLIPQLSGQEKEKQTKELSELKPMEDYRSGGKVPGEATFPGDDTRNDTVPAMLSPGEVVVPRSAVNDQEEFKKFMSDLTTQHTKPKENLTKGGLVKASVKPPTAPQMAKAAPKPVSAPVIPQRGINPNLNPNINPEEASRKKAVSSALGALSNLHRRVSNLEGRR